MNKICENINKNNTIEFWKETERNFKNFVVNF